MGKPYLQKIFLNTVKNEKKKTVVMEMDRQTGPRRKFLIQEFGSGVVRRMECMAFCHIRF